MHSAAVKDEIEKRIGAPAEGGVSFLGSGDFHHISNILIGRINQPLSVVVFDHHPDWDTLPPRFGCGSWVTES